MLDNVFSSTDTAVYFIIGAVGTTLFTIRVVMLLVFGGDVGGDFDVDVGGDGIMDVHDVGFNIISLLSIMAFMMGFGWMGLLARSEWGFGRFPSAAMAFGFGFGLLMLSSTGMYMMKRLQQSGHYDIRNAVGKTGRVYLTVPAKDGGSGQVEVNIDGRRTVVPAVSTNQKIEAFAAVKVVGVRDDGTLIIEPVA